MSVTYLSDPWIDAADSLLRSVPIDPPIDPPGFAIEIVVVDAPGGDQRYTVTFDGAGMSAARTGGSDTVTTVRLTQGYETAVAIARGRLSAQTAFLAADIQLGGDVATLIAHAGLIAQLGDALEPLRETTEFAPTS